MGLGLGKTTLSNALSKKLNIPATHIDGIHHLPNWQIRDNTERDKMILDIVKNKKWIIDGTYKSTLKQRLEAADLIIWLDYSSFTQIKGILKRTIQIHGQEKEEIPGCKEKMTKEFFFYTWNFRKNKRHYIVDNLDNKHNDKLLHFLSQRQLNKWRKENGIKF